MNPNRIKKNEIINGMDILNSIKHVDKKGGEYFYARELQQALGYTEWRKFSKCITKAKKMMKTNGVNSDDHFVGADKMVNIGSDAKRKVKDYKLTKYACYCISVNCDIRKPMVAIAKEYFVVSTMELEESKEAKKIIDRVRMAEDIYVRESLKFSYLQLQDTLSNCGVEPPLAGKTLSKFDEAFYGGKNTKQMKEHLGLPSNYPLADYLGYEVSIAKTFANMLTNGKIKADNLIGYMEMTECGVKINKKVRNLIKETFDEYPEDLIGGLEHDIKKRRKVYAREIKEIFGIKKVR